MRSSYEKLFVLAVVLGIAVLLLAPMRSGTGDVLTLDVQTLRLTSGESSSVGWRMDGTAEQTLTWRSEDPAVAVVNAQGTVTAIAPGSTRIRVKASGGASTSLHVEVIGSNVTGMRLNTDHIVMYKGDVSGLKCVFDNDQTSPAVVWTSEDPSIASVDASGHVTALGAGETVVSASVGGLSARAVVTVNVATTGVTVLPANITVGVGSSFAMTAHFTPEDATDEVIGWSSSDVRVLTVDDQGVMHAVSTGSATVTARTRQGMDGIASVVVEPGTAGLALSASEMTLERGSVHQLETWFYGSDGLPDDSVEHHVEWSCSDPEVLKVEDGTLTALSTGSATVTAVADGYAAECVVTVRTTVQSITIEPAEVYVLREQTSEPIPLKVTLLPEDADDLSVTYETSNDLVANVSREGIVTLTGGYGSADITITAYGGLQAVFRVHVVTELPELEGQETVPAG